MADTHELLTYTVRYEGLDAARHEIEVASLAESLAGVSKILSVVGHFATRQELRLKPNTQEVKVMTRGGEARCYEISMALQWAQQNQLLAGSIPAFVTLLVTMVMTLRKRDEMKRLQAVAEKAIEELGHKDDAVIAELMRVIHRMIDKLQPSARKAVAPIDVTCSTIQFGEGNNSALLDGADKAALLDEMVEVEPEATHRVMFTEMDIMNATGKFHFVQADDEVAEGRLRAVISDPQIGEDNNPYLVAFSSKTPINVRGKLVKRDGEIRSLYVSDTV